MATALDPRKRKPDEDVIYTRIHVLPESSKDVLEMNTLIRQRWEVVSKLGAGSHSEVFGAYDHQLLKEVAIKAGTSKKRLMSDEAAILQKLEHSPYFCRYISHFVHDGVQMLMMDLQGPSLSLINTHYGPLCLETVAKLAQQMLGAIRDLHNVGYIHGDIKPGNFVTGLPPNDMDKIYLIDFSLSKKYLTKEKKVVPSSVHPFGFPGTMKYVSPVLHQTRQLCRRDDFFSMIFTLLEFRGQLPWGNLKIAASVLESKLTTTDDLIKERMGDKMIYFKNYIHRLPYHEEPDYERLEGYIDDMIRENKLNLNREYEWVTNPHRIYRVTRINNDIRSPNPERIGKERRSIGVAPPLRRSVTSDTPRRSVDSQQRSRVSNPRPSIPDSITQKNPHSVARRVSKLRANTQDKEDKSEKDSTSKEQFDDESRRKSRSSSRRINKIPEDRSRGRRNSRGEQDEGFNRQSRQLSGNKCNANRPQNDPNCEKNRIDSSGKNRRNQFKEDLGHSSKQPSGNEYRKNNLENRNINTSLEETTKNQIKSSRGNNRENANVVNYQESLSLFPRNEDTVDSPTSPNSSNIAFREDAKHENTSENLLTIISRPSKVLWMEIKGLRSNNNQVKKYDLTMTAFIKNYCSRLLDGTVFLPNLSDPFISLRFEDTPIAVKATSGIKIFSGCKNCLFCSGRDRLENQPSIILAF